MRKLTAIGWALLAIVGCRAQDVPVPGPAAAPDWNVTAANLSRELARARETAAAPDVRDSNLPLVALAIEKLQLRALSLYKDATYEGLQELTARSAEEALARLKAGQVACAGQTGGERSEGFLERAYECRTDGSPQPYFVRLPADYNADRAWPLVIFLHGYVGDTSIVKPWVLPPPQWKLAADRGMILCLPHGRRNSDFLGIGEVDVLRVVEELQRFYKIDPDRIFMTGCSMGGYGAWALGLRHPSRWGALSLISGQTDFFTWERRKREETPYKSWCVEQNNPLDLAVNARWLPMLVQHGELDNLVPVEHSRLIAPVMAKLGFDFTYQEYKGEGHYIYWTDTPFEHEFDFLKGKQRVGPPKRVTFKTYTPKQGQAYWLDIRRLGTWGLPGEVDASVADGTLKVQATNIAELYLDVPDSLRGGGTLKVLANGRAAGALAAGPHKLTLTADAATLQPGAPPAARPRVGPAREVFNRGFAVVYGTGGDLARQSANLLRARRFRQVWWQFAEGLAPTYSDQQLTAELVQQRNLVIFGEPSTVKLPGLPEPAKTLPAGVTVEPGHYKVGEREFTEAGLGMFVLVPHPLNPEGLILWCSGADYGQGLPVNHQFDLLPDLLIYRGGADWDGTNPYVLGGFLSPDFTLERARLDLAPAPAQP